MRRWRHALAGYDLWVLTAYLALAVIGVLFVYSASTDYSLLHYGDPYRLIRRQILYTLLGVALALAVGWVDYRFWRRWAVYGLAVAAIIAFWDLLTGQPGITFLWIGPASLVVSIGASLIFSLIPLKGKGPKTVILWSLLLLIPVVLVFVLIVK